MQTAANFPMDNIPEGCKHLFGQMFMIPFGVIRAPEDGENPRTLTELGLSVLLDKRLSADLRESIKNHTLLCPLVCRWVKEGDTYYPKVIGGERRYRGLDFLIRKREMVADPRSVQLDNGEWVYDFQPADEVYASVPCQVFAVNDDLEALELSWAENKNRINLTDGHEIAEVIKLRECNADDERILSILQRDEKWLRDTDKLIASLDDDTLKDLLESRIDRASAMDLASIEDVQVRTQVRAAANQASQVAADRKVKKLQKQVDAALEEQDIAESVAADGDFHEGEESVADAKAAVETAKTKVRRVVKERDNAKPVTTAKDVKKAVADLEVDIDEERSERKPSAKKVATYGIEYVSALIRGNGRCPEGTFIAEVDQLILLKSCLTNILDGKMDFADTIRSHINNIQEQEYEEDEQESEDNSDSDE